MTEGRVSLVVERNLYELSEPTVVQRSDAVAGNHIASSLSSINLGKSYMYQPRNNLFGKDATPSVHVDLNNVIRRICQN